MLSNIEQLISIHFYQDDMSGTRIPQTISVMSRDIFLMIHSSSLDREIYRYPWHGNITVMMLLISFTVAFSNVRFYRHLRLHLCAIPSGRCSRNRSKTRKIGCAIECLVTEEEHKTKDSLGHEVKDSVDHNLKIRVPVTSSLGEDEDDRIAAPCYKYNP